MNNYRDTDSVTEDVFKNMDADVIVSFPGSFFLIGEHCVMKGHFGVNHILPFYAHVGIKELKTEELICNLYKYDPLTGNRKKKETKSSTQEITEKIKKAFEIENIPCKYKITIYSEIPLACGLNSSGAISAAISTGIQILKKEISHRDVKVWKTTQDLHQLEKDERFIKTFNLAWEIENQIQCTKSLEKNECSDGFECKWSSGIGPFVSMVGNINSLPIIYMRNIKKKQFHGWFLSDFLTDEISNNWKNCLYAIIHSGYPQNTGKVLKTLKSAKYRIYQEPVSQFIRNYKKKMIDPNDVPKLMNKLVEEDIEKIGLYIDNRAFDTLGGYSILFISNIEKDYAMNIMNLFQATLASWNLSTEEIDKICIKAKMEGIGAKLTGSGKGGCVVLYSSNPEFKDTMEDVIEQIQENERVQCLYKSWEENNNSMDDGYQIITYPNNDEKGIIAVEGKCEKIFIKKFYYKITGRDLESDGINIKNLRGIGNWKNFLEDEFEIKRENVLILIDRDDSKNKKKIFGIIEKLKLNEKFHKNNIIHLGEKEFEDMFSDKIIKDCLNKHWPKLDNEKWDIKEIKNFRQQKKISQTIIDEIKRQSSVGKNISKPDFAEKIVEFIEEEDLKDYPKLEKVMLWIYSRLK